MRNYIFFYLVLIIFIAGGIHLTTYSLEKQKKEKLEGTNHQQRIGEFLDAGDQLKSADIEGKTLVLFSWNEFSSKPEDFIQLNELVKNGPANLEVLAISQADKEYGESYFIRKKIKPEFKTLHNQRAINQYLQELVSNFYDSDSLKLMKVRNPLAVVIDANGKVKLGKIGGHPKLMDEIKQAAAK